MRIFRTEGHRGADAQLAVHFPDQILQNSDNAISKGSVRLNGPESRTRGSPGAASPGCWRTSRTGPPPRTRDANRGVVREVPEHRQPVAILPFPDDLPVQLRTALCAQPG